MTDSRSRPARRRGASLVELVIVIGAVSTILTLCGGLLHTLFRIERAGRDSLADASTAARLARQFRQDVRGSRTARAAGEGGPLELARPGGASVTYRAEAGRLVREERDGSKIARREAFAVARLGPVTLRTEGPLVRLVLAKRPTNPHAPARPAVVVEATLDKDRAPGAPPEDRE